MKEEKLTEEEKLNNQLRNFTIEEIEAYIELLLTKSLEAVEKEDLTTYGSIEKTLNNSLIIFSSKVRNFNILYNRIKLRVANKFLKKYLNNNSLSVLEDVSITGTFLSVEEATKITESKEFLAYKEAKANLTVPTKVEVFDNNKYFVDYYSSYEICILDKDTGIRFNCEELQGSTEVLKALVEGESYLLDNDKLIYKDVPIEAIAVEEERILKYKHNSLEIEEYFNFNDSFIVQSDFENGGFIDIIHKTTKTKCSIWASCTNDTVFLIQFFDYCLGKQGKRIKDIDLEDSNFFNKVD